MSERSKPNQDKLSLNTLKLDLFEQESYAAAFKCVKCPDISVPIDPYNCDKGHIFCKQCINDCIENKQRCPSDTGNNHEINNSTQNITVKNIINSLQIKCPISYRQIKDDEKSDDLPKCDWIGTIGSLYQHLSQCKIYLQLNQIDEITNKINQNFSEFKSLIDELQNKNLSMKQSMNPLQFHRIKLTVTNLTNAIRNFKQDIYNIDTNDELAIIGTEVEVSQHSSIVGICNQCNQSIQYSSNAPFNAKLINNNWQHINCDHKESKLISDNKYCDEWYRGLGSNKLKINNRLVSLDINHTTSHYYSVFGSIVIKRGDGIKQWRVRINKLQSEKIYIGIVNSSKLAQSLSDNGYKNGISMDGNGKIYRFNKDAYQSGHIYKESDIVSIVLDIDNELLLFIINEDDVITVPLDDVHIQLKQYQWKLYASLYNPADQILLLGDNKAKSVLDDEEIAEYNCGKCSSLITSRDFEINNLVWDNQWKHADCELSQYKLMESIDEKEETTDEFNKCLAFKDSLSLSNNNRTFMTYKSSNYQTAYGVINVKNKTQKIWNVLIEKRSSNIYIGVIDSSKIKNVNNKIPTDGAYYLSYDGNIGGNDSITKQSSLSYSAGDVVSVILDLDKYTLGFGVNSDKYRLVHDANLKDKSYNLFVTLYGSDDIVTIVDNNDKDSLPKPEMMVSVGVCCACNSELYSGDFDINNVSWDKTNNKWKHIDCNFELTVPKLKLTDIDIWHPFLSHSEMKIYDKYNAIGGNSNRLNVFGVISVNKGVKKWDVQIGAQTSYMYVGIINKNIIKNSEKGLPSKQAYYLEYNGYIRGDGLRVSTGYSFKGNDVINVILDKDKKNSVFWC